MYVTFVKKQAFAQSAIQLTLRSKTITHSLNPQSDWHCAPKQARILINIFPISPPRYLSRFWALLDKASSKSHKKWFAFIFHRGSSQKKNVCSSLFFFLRFVKRGVQKRNQKHGDIFLHLLTSCLSLRRPFGQ
jgi:hypothetical protein